MLYRIQNTSTAWGYWLVILRNFYVSISRILECLGMWGSCILHCVAKWAMVTFKGGNCPKAWNTRFLTGLIFLPTLLVVFIVYTLAFGNSGFLFKDSWDHFQSFFFECVKIGCFGQDHFIATIVNRYFHILFCEWYFLCRLCTWERCLNDIHDIEQKVKIWSVSQKSLICLKCSFNSWHCDA